MRQFSIEGIFYKFFGGIIELILKKYFVKTT